VTVIAGGFEIDLRQAAMMGAEASIEVFAMMGGAVFRVPESWKVELNVTPLLGGTDMKARTVPPAEGLPKILRINGFIMMGGVEVKN
jgi:predicted membrane protein